MLDPSARSAQEDVRRPVSETGRQRRVSPSTYELVDSDVLCVLTRIKVRRPWTVVRMWRLFHQVQAQSRRVSGLWTTRFLLEGPRTFLILSIWQGDWGFLDFGTDVTAHPPAVREALRHAAGGRQLEVWSTEWRLHAVSNNINWDGFRSWAVTGLEGTGPGRTNEGNTQ